MKDSSGCISADRNYGNLPPNINPDMENIIFVSYDMVQDARRLWKEVQKEAAHTYPATQGMQERGM